MRVLVVGADSFIGSAAVATLTRAGIAVRAWLATPKSWRADSWASRR